MLRFAERLLSTRALGRTSSQHNLLTCCGFAVEAVYTALIHWLQLALCRLGSRCAVEGTSLPQLSASCAAKLSRNCLHAVTQCLRHTDCEVLLNFMHTQHAQHGLIPPRCPEPFPSPPWENHSGKEPLKTMLHGSHGQTFPT